MIKSITYDSYFDKKPTSRWVDFKTTHQLNGCTQNLHMCIHYLGAIIKIEVLQLMLKV